MMAEYINRDDLLKAAWDKPTLSLSVYDIGNIKPVDVAPVRHGRWEEADWIECSTNDLYIRTPRGARRCSECKRCFKKELLWKDNYCPNCGAKMNGKST